MKKNIFILAVMLLLPGCSSNEEVDTTAEEQEDTFLSAQDAVSKSIPVVCEDDVYEIYIDGENIRADMVTGTMLIKGKEAWVWDDNEGAFYDYNEETASGQNPAENIMKTIEETEMQCEEISIDGPLFQAPSDVKFVNREITEYLLEKAAERGIDNAVKAQMGLVKEAAKRYIETAGGYAGFCESTEQKALADSITSIGGKNYYCDEKEDSWASQVTISDGYWCVDSAGSSKQLGNPKGGPDITNCP